MLHVIDCKMYKAINELFDLIIHIGSVQDKIAADTLIHTNLMMNFDLLSFILQM